MRSSFLAHRGAPLTRTLNLRQQAQRRWTVVVAAVAALAIGSAAIGALTAGPDADTARTTPLSYLSEQ